MHRTTAFAASALVAVATVCGGGAAADAPRVVATIKPVHSLVAAVMGEVGTPVLLVEGTRSPHGYSLKPSQARALSEAQLVFWIGEGLETFLVKPLASLAGDAQVVELGAAPGLVRLATREGGVWAGTGDAADADEEDEQAAGDHGHDAIDMHLWLDPQNAQAMGRAIVAALAAADPDHAERYQANGAALDQQLGALDAAMEEKLGPVRERPFVVFHDAYHYLEQRYRLNAVGAISVDPARRPSARRLQEIRRALGEREVACVFAEPQFEPALVVTIVEGTGVRSAALDPLGATLDPGPTHYLQLLEGLAASLVACLAPTSRPG